MIKDHINSIYEICKPYTLLSYERICNNINSVDYIYSNNIKGDIVEIGVFKGGSIMSMIISNQILNDNRTFYLYDTFEGMTEPNELDTISSTNQHFNEVKNEHFMCECSIELVKNNINKLNYDTNMIKYIKGDITKNSIFPDSISILRLDTDFYVSTKYELDYFYNRVTPGGIVIIDDYGYWNGARKATDEFLSDKPYIKLIPIDDTGVYFYKPYITENLQIFENRNDMLKLFDKNLVMMEIGVFRGDFSEQILVNCKPKKLILIDPWIGNINSGNEDGNNVKIYNGNELYNMILQKFSNNNIIDIIRDFSYNYIPKIEANSVDLIYIDGDHSYEGCLKDLELSYNIIKNQGYICGHDYLINKNKCKYDYNFGVYDAVNHFCKKYSQKIGCLGFDGCVSYTIKIEK